MFLIARMIGGFRKRSEGNATIEFTLWFPFIMMLVALLTDLSLIYNGRGMATKVLQDADRLAAVGVLRTNSETEAYIKGRLSTVAPNAVARTTKHAGVLTSSVTIPLSDLDATGWFDLLRHKVLVVSSQQYVELYEDG